MVSPFAKILKITGGRGRLWSRSCRQAALREMEEQFDLRLTEEEVFRAATLFFSLLSGYSLIRKEVVANEVHRQLAMSVEEEEKDIV
jgi:hypothetical protein